MCLISKKYCAKIALKDIECYKILVLDDDGSFTTPFRHVEVSGEIVAGKRSFTAHEIISRRRNWCGNVDVLGGVIHTYVKQDEAEDEARYLLRCDGEQTKLFKCIIPRGTRYFVGEYSDYASKRIRFIEEIKLD